MIHSFSTILHASPGLSLKRSEILAFKGPTPQASHSSSRVMAARTRATMFGAAWRRANVAVEGCGIGAINNNIALVFASDVGALPCDLVRDHLPNHDKVAVDGCGTGAIKNDITLVLEDVVGVHSRDTVRDLAWIREPVAVDRCRTGSNQNDIALVLEGMSARSRVTLFGSSPGAEGMSLSIGAALAPARMTSCSSSGVMSACTYVLATLLQTSTGVRHWRQQREQGMRAARAR